MAAAASAPERSKPHLSRAEGWWARNARLSEGIYWALHASCLLGIWVHPSEGDLLLLAATFYIRLFAITGGYHRYFAHRAYKTSRGFQFLLALCGCAATQKGPLWWAAHHREHHRCADRPGDVHSPREGFYYAHQGWIFDDRWDATPTGKIRDFEELPELVWLNRWYPVPPALLALACTAIGGFSGLLWGFVVSTVLLWHTTYTVNSFAHRFGARRFETSDTSRNNWWVALLTLGEGWHNNHHHYCASARQGFRWWEIDVTYYLLRGLEALGIVREIREPPRHLTRGSSLREAA